MSADRDTLRVAIIAGATDCVLTPAEAAAFIVTFLLAATPSPEGSRS